MVGITEGETTIADVGVNEMLKIESHQGDQPYATGSVTEHPVSEVRKMEVGRLKYRKRKTKERRMMDVTNSGTSIADVGSNKI